MRRLLLSLIPAVALVAQTPHHAHRQQISSLAVQPGGQLVALGGFKEVRLADHAGKVVATLPGHAEVVRALAFSADGKLLAAAGGLPGRKGEVKVWNLDTKTEVATISGHKDCIYAVAFAPDGKTIATASYDKLIKLWDASTGAEGKTLKDHIDAIYALQFTADGTRLLSGAADRTVKIWNPATGERLYTLGDPTDGINTIALSPDGKRVAAAGQDKSIRIWSLGANSGTLLHQLIAHEDAVLRLAWSPDGKTIASSGADRIVKLFRADDLTELRSIEKQSDWAYGLEWLPGGKLLVGRFDGSLTTYAGKDLAPTAQMAQGQ